MLQAGHDERMRIFPRVRARSLEGRELDVPDDLDGELRCIVVAFRREHQQLVDTWLAHLDSIATSNPAFRYYEMPTISRRWTPARRFIDGGMAMAIADRAARERTLTVYTNLEPIITALGLAGTDDIAIALVDAHGVVVWQATGAFTTAAGARLSQAVA